MELLSAYIPTDRRHALAAGRALPDRTEGAALFADISGFTPLTEALLNALGPRRGAEELTRQLNQVFDAIIAEVDGYSGSVMVFSGDAITCWFDGDTGLRAIACGLAMQQAMQQFATITTPTGTTVSLAMKVSIAAGPARRFQIGDANIQLIDALAGATLDRMVAGEKQANKGEVMVDAETLAHLTAAVTVAREVEDEHGRFAAVSALTVAVPRLPWPPLPASLAEDQLRPWLLPPVYERVRDGQAQFLAEIRPAVVLFLSFTGIDYDHDPEAGVKLDQYLRATQTVLNGYEGFLLQLTIGDKGSYIYATFGAPLAHDDDAARAVSASLDLQALTQRYPFIQDVSIGLNQGRMWTGAYGGTTRHTYGVLGDVVNVAARLMGKAAPGQIIVSPTIQQAISGTHELESLGMLKLKGKTEPLPASRVMGVRRLTAPVINTYFTTPLVGRTAERATFITYLDEAVQRHGQIVRVTGGAGIGKSHLATEFAIEAVNHDFVVTLGVCQSISQEIYTPWRAVFRKLFAVSDTATPEEAILDVHTKLQHANPAWLVRLPLLGDLLNLPIPDNDTTAHLDPRLRQEALLALAVSVLEYWTRQRPLLILIDDAHWLDEGSENLLLAFARVLHRLRAILLIVHRPPVRAEEKFLADLQRLTYAHTLTLDELTLADLAGLLKQRFAGPPSALVLALVQAKAQGNPFFAQELFNALREEGHLRQTEAGEWHVSENLFNLLREGNCLTRLTDHDGWTLAPNAPLAAINAATGGGIPDSIHGVVLARVDRLPEAPKTSLKVASVVGRSFEFAVLHGAHPTHPSSDHLLSHLNLLSERDFTRQEATSAHASHAFKNNAIAEVMYDTLLAAQQRDLHQAVGRALEHVHPDGVDELAHHFSRAGDGGRTQALVYLEKAAVKARAEYANETALNYYTQLLGLDERWFWRVAQIQVLHNLGRREPELSALRALEAMSSAPTFDTAYAWGEYYEAIGDYPQAQLAVERALAADPAALDEVRCLSQLGLIARRQGDYTLARERYAQALTAFAPETALDTRAAEAMARALIGLSRSYQQQGQYDEARGNFERALEMAREHGHRQLEAEALSGLGGAAYIQRNFTEALTMHQQALDLRRAIGDRAGEGISLYNLAAAFQDLGDYGQTQKYFTEALVTQQAIGNRWEEVNILNGLGVLYQNLGDYPRAEDYLRQGLQISRDINDEGGQAYLLSNLGPVARDLGNLQAAREFLNEGLALAQKQNDRSLMAFFLSHLSQVNLLAHRFRDGIDLAITALTIRRELDLAVLTTADLATLAALHSRLRELKDARAYAQQAFQLLEDCHGEGPEFPHRDYFMCYQVLTDLGDEALARRALLAASALLTTQAEKITDPALRQSFLTQVPIHQQILEAARRLST